MSEIEMPIKFALDGKELFLAAKMDAFVSLDQPQAKGIHMSRLYLTLREYFEKQCLSPSGLKDVLQKFIEGQKGLSQKSYLKINFDLPVKRKALLSDEVGWRQYPVYFEAKLIGQEFHLNLGARITYSSTCPCSAALSRQLLQEKLSNDFAGRENLDLKEVVEWLGLDRSIVATPHAQRSFADVKIKVRGPDYKFEILELIDQVEKHLGTPVQAAVKRQDEQEFARLNAANLMFCEDAARRIRASFEATQQIEAYSIRVEHVESLHPHSAVSSCQKGF